MVQSIAHVKASLAAFLALLLLCVPSYAQENAPDTAKLNADLVYQAFFGTGEAIIELVEKGANPHALNNDGVPALSLAATRKNEKGLDALKALFASRVDLNQPDMSGQTALFYAARVGNLDAIKLLLDMGADYYHTDKKGNIARNVAYDRGYMDVFAYMDGFVNHQREEVMKDYEQRARQIEEREKAQADAIEKAKKEAAEKKLKEAAIEKPKKKQKPVKTELSAEERIAFEKAVRKLSQHACSMQYWYFVKSAGLKTPLTSRQLSDKITEQRALASAEEEKLHALGATHKYISKITEPSKDQIYHALEKLGSNITRKSHGIGEIGDDETRCTEVADGWVIEMPN